MAQRTNGKARLGIQVFLGQPPLGSLLCQAADGPISHTLAWKEGKEGAELPVKLRVQGKFPSPRAVLGAVFEPLLLSLTSPAPAGHPHLPQSLLRCRLPEETSNELPSPEERPRSSRLDLSLDVVSPPSLSFICPTACESESSPLGELPVISLQPSLLLGSSY